MFEVQGSKFTASPSETTAFSFLFVGRLVPLKGVDLLLRGFSQAGLGSARLRVVGDGPERANLATLAASLGIQERIQWLGQAEAAQAQAQMGVADVVILPSRKDGWGAVVNESLLAGTPVICSTACGAVDLVRHPWLGTIFRSGNVQELSAALRDWAGKGKGTDAERARIRNWSACITGQRMAEYFLDIMAHIYLGKPCPEAPWRLALD
jgi:glycosyltransferase involved in cell wall biosynthesis